MNARRTPMWGLYLALLVSLAIVAAPDAQAWGWDWDWSWADSKDDSGSDDDAKQQDDDQKKYRGKKKGGDEKSSKEAKPHTSAPIDAPDDPVPAPETVAARTTFDAPASSWTGADPYTWWAADGKYDGTHDTSDRYSCPGTYTWAPQSTLGGIDPTNVPLVDGDFSIISDLPLIQIRAPLA
ncbi:MAG: hypothetical protein QNJ98_09670, partial [Planctomycetota bacterium]|nr:hypothetical protein [Planctomycetota bacterium]